MKPNIHKTGVWRLMKSHDQHYNKPKKNFFYFVEKMFLFQDIQVFVFLTIPWLTKSVTLWWVSVHETGCIFEYFFEPQALHFWTKTHSVTKFGQLIDISKSNNFQEQTGATFLVIFYSVTFSNYSITNYVKIPMFHFIFLKRWIVDN